MFPPDVSTHAPTVYATAALGTLFIVVGSAWYYLLGAGAVTVLRRGGYNI
jgi:hypothetical protein